MKIGLVYKLYKEGKLNLTKEEMDELWRFYDGLSFYQMDDRFVINSYKYIVGCLTGVNPYNNQIWTEEDKIENFKSAEDKLKRAAQSLIDGYDPSHYLS